MRIRWLALVLGVFCSLASPLAALAQSALGARLDQVLTAPSSPPGSRFFGISLSVDGNTLVIGDQPTPAQNTLPNIVYVYTRSSPGSPWSFAATLEPADPTLGRDFGFVTDVHQSVIVASSLAGAHVYLEPPGGWSGVLTENALLVPSSGESSSGMLVALSGDTVVTSSKWWGVAGEAHVYVPPASGWTGTLTESAILRTSIPEYLQMFAWGGLAVSRSEDLVVVGAPGAWSLGLSRAYVFERPASGWAGALTESAELTRSRGGGGGLGSTARIRGRTLYVGALADETSGAVENGAIYVYEEPPNGWSGIVTEDAILVASRPQPMHDLGGGFLAASGRSVWGGTIYDRNSGVESGAVWGFSEPVAGWQPVQTEARKLVPRPPRQSQFFGLKLAADRATLIANVANLGEDPSRGAVLVYTIIAWTVRLAGVAQGGSVTLTVEGVSLMVPTAPGEAAQSVALRLAQAVDGDAALRDGGFGARSAGPVLTTNSQLSSLAIDDPGLSMTPVPATGASGWLVAAAAIAVAAGLLVHGKKRLPASRVAPAS